MSIISYFPGGGGSGGGARIEFDYYWGPDVKFSQSTAAELGQVRRKLVGLSAGAHALFAGGDVGNSYYNTVDAYNASLTRSTATELSVARSDLAGATVGEYALFAGGKNGSSVYSTVNAYNASLTRNVLSSLRQSTEMLAGASVGDYALFAGGQSSSSYNNVTNVYSLTAVYTFILFPGTKYAFNGAAEKTVTAFGALSINAPITGYIEYADVTLSNDW